MLTGIGCILKATGFCRNHDRLHKKHIYSSEFGVGILISKTARDKGKNKVVQHRCENVVRDRLAMLQFNSSLNCYANRIHFRNMQINITRHIGVPKTIIKERVTWGLYFETPNHVNIF